MNYLRIKELLKEKGYTAKDLAQEFEITENGLSLIINGKRQPRFELLEKLAEKLEVEVWQLFSGSGNALNGFVEYRSEIYRIQTQADMERLLEIVKRSKS